MIAASAPEQVRPWCSIGRDGSLSADGFRAVTEATGRCGRKMCLSRLGSSSLAQMVGGRGCSAGRLALVRAAFEKKRRNRLSFLARIAFGRVPLSPPIPVTGIGDIALDAMQPGMDPCAFGTRIILGDVVSGLPIPAQSVPHGPEQWDGNRRWVAGLQSVKKGSDFCIHKMTFAE